jgi:hypothetical protein
MPRTQRTDQEIARIAEEIYQRDIRPKLRPQDKGKYLTLDIKSGDYEIDDDDLSLLSAGRRPRLLRACEEGPRPGLAGG